ncbi:hypothetical protein PPERSA_11357 [Pseudocohnilembus persalinus]|uniref:Uncharacterized protein n=1 Tax=Pseudocohnilembus persalinus TaxID=266149 RepID=A0A0V0QPN1_PSEPJ|nr:hypothetical protein PPERSA_11357 [Pseudocohnilembus persalinus]|eukprot:KRX04233.1 hypothetical protein PPERSA_11357 [Pseudocohnilembus persalinus]
MKKKKQLLSRLEKQNKLKEQNSVSSSRSHSFNNYKIQASQIISDSDSNSGSQNSQELKDQIDNNINNSIIMKKLKLTSRESTNLERKFSNNQNVIHTIPQSKSYTNLQIQTQKSKKNSSKEKIELKTPLEQSQLDKKMSFIQQNKILVKESFEQFKLEQSKLNQRGQNNGDLNCQLKNQIRSQSKKKTQKIKIVSELQQRKQQILNLENQNTEKIEDQILSTFYPNYQVKREIQDEKQIQWLLAQADQNMDEICEEFKNLELRQKTFGRFGFRTVEKEDNFFLRPVVKEFTGNDIKGSMNIIDLWTEQNIKKIMQQVELQKDKELLKKIAHMKMTQKSFQKSEDKKNIYLNRKEEKNLIPYRSFISQVP